MDRLKAIFAIPKDPNAIKLICAPFIMARNVSFTLLGGGDASPYPTYNSGRELLDGLWFYDPIIPR